MHRLALALPPLFCALALLAAPNRPASFSLDQRVPLTTSRVVGSPEQPPPFRTRRVFEKHSFRNPVYAISHPAHDRLFIIEQNGKIVHLPPSGKEAVPGDFCKLTDADAYGMTFHPDYRKNRFVYVFANGPNSAKRKKNQILRFTTVGDPPRCDMATRKLIIDWESNGHNGGDLGFGRDGMLYITSGDGTSDSDGDNTGQDLRDLCSGMLRIDVDRPAEGKGYAIPKDNPFLKEKGARGELWAFGFRNPWRMHFDRDDLYVGDVGQDWVEMIWLVRKGGNYGWSVREGTKEFQPLRPKGPGAFQSPLIEHPHSESRSITGGFVYRGKKFPKLQGVYIYGDYSTGKVWGLKQANGKVTWKGDLAWTRLQIVGFGTDAAGEVYLVDYAGQIHVLEEAPPVKDTGTFPRKLSEAGLFADVSKHQPHAGLIPYSVNSPLWSDGADKERFIALPGTQRITFRDKGGPWTFPEKTVLVKTFSIDTPAGRKRIETRLLTLQEGEWIGYTYAWNDAQTDADLVASLGKDATFTIRDDSSSGKKASLAWRFPSRVECMVCHTRAANYTLGLTTMQMNRDHDYGGVVMNQLDALQVLGVLQVPGAIHDKARKQRLNGAQSLAQLLEGEDNLANPFRKPFFPRAGKPKALRGDRSDLPCSPNHYPRLADPSDRSAGLEDRVRSYLQANCAHCHVWAGGGNSAIDLHADTPLAKMRLIGERPLHERFGREDALLVAPGSPDRSVLYQRLARRGKGQMPPLASSRVDAEGVRLLREWVRGLE